jgi:hypothetical protein
MLAIDIHLAFAEGAPKLFSGAVGEFRFNIRFVLPPVQLARSM